MKQLFSIHTSSAAALLACAALCSCSDSDFDFDNVDSSIGIGVRSLTLPTSSSDKIILDDLLDLNEGDCVKADANGDYVLSLAGGEVKAAEPEIERVVVIHKSSRDLPIPIVFATGLQAKGRRAAAHAVSFDADAYEFVYGGDRKDGIVDMSEVGAEGEATFRFHFPAGLSQYVGKFDKLTIAAPSYMYIKEVQSTAAHTATAHGATFTDVPTATDFTATFVFDKLHFGEADHSLGTLALNETTVDMEGRIHVSGSASSFNAATGAMPDFSFSGNTTISDVVITSATGRFDPKVEMDDLGRADINSVPDFLTDEKVVADVDNPQIFIDFDSDLPVGGIIDGTLTAVKDGHAIAKVDVKDIPLRPATKSQVLLCRHRPAALPEGVTDVVECDALGQLIRTIPDHIQFDADARADASQTVRFELGRKYRVQPAYNVSAPVAFGKDAVIVYNKDESNWNKDLTDISLDKGTTIVLDADVQNCVPAYLTLRVKPIDLQGREMSPTDITVDNPETVIASADGQNPATKHITVRIAENSGKAFKSLDGVRLSIEMTAADDGQNPVTGITLNKDKHYIQLSNVKAHIEGNVVVNDDND